MKKFITLLLITLFVSLNLTAYQGVMSGQKNLKVIETEFFDIIFPEECSQSAAILATEGDKVYIEIAKQFPLPNTFRLPVVLTPAQDSFNAYFTAIPFNHIVMYDTTAPASLTVYKDTFLEVFKHELTHAINTNYKNNFWHGLSTIFGDFYSPANIGATSAVFEGTAVNVESQKGTGRLNDSFALHPVRQAKIEDDFPNFSDIQVTTDVYPYGNQCYMFGGVFTQWLIEKYGKEKFAEYWYRIANLKNIFYYESFKKVYGIHFYKAWQQFAQDLKIPEVSYNPKKSTLFTKPFKTDKRSLYKNLRSCDKGIYFMDNAKGSIFFAGNDKNNSGRTKKIISDISLSEFTSSKNGRFLTLSCLDYNKKVSSSVLKIYDTEKKSLFTVENPHLKNGLVFSYQNEYYLAAVKSSSQNASLTIFKINFNKYDKIFSTDFIKEISLPYQDLIFSFTDSGKGDIYFIYRTGINSYIAKYNLNEENFKCLPLPSQNIKITSLSIQSYDNENTVIYFTYASKDSLPRTGILTIGEEEITFKLQSNNFSGGTFTPVSFDGKKIIYAANFYKNNSIFEADAELFNFIEEKFPLENKNIISESVRQNIDTSVLENAKSFKSSKYLFKGSLIPISTAASYLYSDSGLEQIPFIYGLSFVSSSPWTNPYYILSAGYSPLTNSTALSFYINGGTDTSLLNYTLSSNVEFDSLGYKQTNFYTALSSKFYLNHMFYFQIAETLTGFQGRQSIKTVYQSNDIISTSSYYGTDNVNNLYLFNDFGLSFGNLVKNGIGYYQNAGVNISSTINTGFYMDINNKENTGDYKNISFGLTFALPRILPFENPQSLVFNLPYTLQTNIFPSNRYLCAAKSKLILFSAQIDRSTNYMPVLFLNRFSIYAEYESKLRYEDVETFSLFEYKNGIGSSYRYLDTLSLTFDFAMMPAVTSLASNLHFDLTASFNYRFNPDDNENEFDIQICGITIY